MELAHELRKILMFIQPIQKIMQWKGLCIWCRKQFGYMGIPQSCINAINTLIYRCIKPPMRSQNAIRKSHPSRLFCGVLHLTVSNLLWLAKSPRPAHSVINGNEIPVLNNKIQKWSGNNRNRSNKRFKYLHLPYLYHTNHSCGRTNFASEYLLEYNSYDFAIRKTMLYLYIYICVCVFICIYKTWSSLRYNETHFIKHEWILCTETWMFEPVHGSGYH